MYDRINKFKYLSNFTCLIATIFFFFVFNLFFNCLTPAQQHCHFYFQLRKHH